MADTTDYFPVPMKQLILDSDISFNLFLYLQLNNKMLQVMKKGDLLTKKRLDDLFNKNIHVVFILKSDKEDFYKYKAKSFSAVILDEKCSQEKKIEQIKVYTKETIQGLSEVTNLEESVQIMENCSGVTKQIVSDVANKGFAKAFDDITKMIKTGSGLMVHSANVSSLSVIFGMLMNIIEPKELEDLAMGGLLHDLGLSKCDGAIVEKYLKNEHNMPEAEWSAFVEHPMYAMEMLKSRSSTLSKNVLDIVFQHHENFDGTGFPRRIKNMQINYLAKIVRIANDFDIVYRELAAQQKYDQMSNILLFLKNGIIQDNKLREEDMGGKAPKTMYDGRILEELIKNIVPVKEGAGTDALVSGNSNKIAA
ncbi:MAG: HD domain-containing protein [Oligoflexia bacterium]|nr:HD domain-containing protein [Oligoflexia bacterium]